MFPTPPGIASGSLVSGLPGMGSATQRRMRFATGSLPSTGWLVTMVSPSTSAFFTRSATGSTPSAAASLSICASYAKHDCTAPNPRIAPVGGLFVYAPTAWMTAFGTRYGPAPKHAAFATTAGLDEAYAPPSSTIVARTTTRVPSFDAPWPYQSFAG